MASNVYPLVVARKRSVVGRRPDDRRVAVVRVVTRLVRLRRVRLWLLVVHERLDRLAEGALGLPERAPEGALVAAAGALQLLVDAAQRVGAHSAIHGLAAAGRLDLGDRVLQPARAGPGATRGH